MKGAHESLFLQLHANLQLTEKKKFDEKESLSVAMKNVIETTDKLECGLHMRK